MTVQWYLRSELNPYDPHHHQLDHLDHQVSIAVAKELYGNVEFSGNLFVGDQGDNDWVG